MITIWCKVCKCTEAIIHGFIFHAMSIARKTDLPAALRMLFSEAFLCVFMYMYFGSRYRTVGYFRGVTNFVIQSRSHEIFHQRIVIGHICVAACTYNYRCMHYCDRLWVREHA